MKKYLFPALALGLVMTSCQSDEPFAPGEGGEKQVTFTLNVPGELGTRAVTEDNNSGVGGWSNTQGNVSYTLVLSAEGHNQTYKKENVAGNTVTFSPTVVLGREYTVTAYAHFSATAQEDLTSITETKGINDESKDVYFFTTKENVSKPTINFAEGTSYNFDLKRPYAKLRLIAEDYNTSDVNKPITDITKVIVSYNNEVYTVFDAVEGEFKTKANKSYTKDWVANYYEKDVTSGDKTIFADYIPVNGTDVAPFTVTVEYTNGETYTREFNQDIPVRRNALTTLKGNFFTAGAEITVNVEDAFDNNSKEYDLKFTAKEVQAALDAAPEGETTTIYLGATIEGDVIEFQKADRNVIIDGMGNKWNGTIKIHNGSNYNNGTITVKNVNFETSDAERNFIEALDFGEENGVTRRYSNNINVENCTFTSPATRSINEGVVGVQVKATRGVTVKDCTASNIHSLIQAQSCDTGDVKVLNCTINGCKNGVAFKQVKNAVVDDCEITATAYGIRFDGNVDNYGITVKDNEVTAVQPFIVRKMTGKDNTITLEGENTLTTNADYQIVITNGSDDAEYVKPTGTYTLTGADNFLVYPRDYYYPVATWTEFTAALANEPKIKLTADIVFDANYQLQKDVDIDLNDKSMTLPMLNIHTKTTLKNGTINGKVYARKNSDIVFNNVKFSGAVSDNLSTEGHLAIQSGCTLYAKDCLFSPTSVSGSQTKPVSFEGGSSNMKFEDCEFKSSPYKKQVYFNSLSATATLNFTNCNFNNKTPNIMFAAACPLTNLTMSGTTKLSSVTLETNRAKDAVTAEDLAYLRESLIANNSFSSVRLFYAGGSSEYIR